MSPVGFILVIGAVFALRSVAVGRTTDIPSDAKDIVLAFAHADMGSVGEVLSRRGEPQTVGAGSDVVAVDAPAPTSPNASALVNECIRLGSAAKGYVWGATGPDGYDCSGLVWRAMRNLGMFKGVRFTTATFTAQAHLSGWKSVTTPAPGDVVLWQGRHMGVVTGPNRMYSAKSPDRGIGYDDISFDTEHFGSAPSYWRVS